MIESRPYPKYIMLIINYSWHLKKIILFLPDLFQFQLPNINCYCALSEVFIYTVLSAYSYFPQHELNRVSLTLYLVFYKPCSQPDVLCEGEQQLRRVVSGLFSWNVVHRNQKLLVADAHLVLLSVALYCPLICI